LAAVESVRTERTNRAVFGRGRGLLGALLALTQVLLDPANHLSLVIDQVHVGRGAQMRVTKDRLDVPHGQRLIAAHPQSCSMA
jgi:hypothetical protein